jgi:hypothetical protein
MEMEATGELSFDVGHGRSLAGENDTSCGSCTRMRVRHGGHGG